MSTGGHYELRLMCDQLTPKNGDPRRYCCNKERTIVDATRMEALAAAREEGWLIAKNKNAYCPIHADERRASWR